jgi:predicted outer membrane repeat protein
MIKALACFITAIILTSAVGAETLTVTRMDDPQPDGCSLNDCSLREAVIDSGLTLAKDTILLPAGVYLIDLAGPDNSEETGDLDISTDMEFRGEAAIIDGQFLGRIMDISDATVTLRDLTLRNANTSLDTNGTLNAGAVQINGGRLELAAVTLDSNRAQALGGAIRAYGGAIVDIDGCLFIGNIADMGAAIHADTGVTVRNTEFRDNRADAGALGSGAVAYLTGASSDSQFENVFFNANMAAGWGGAVQFLGRKLVIDGLIAMGNHATGRSGGVLSSSGTAHAKQLQIMNALFEGNVAADGGAIALGGDPDTLDISHSSFVDNTTAGNGGALHLTGGDVNVTNATFSGNQATGNGGAAYLYGVDFTALHATFALGSANSGNALFVGGSAGLTVSSFGNNVIDGTCFVQSVGNLTSLGGNVEGPGNSCDLDAGSDLVNQGVEQLGLQPLSDNAGGTPTHHLTAASVARGQGEPALCEMVKVDQLFESRSNCNSGAVESNTIFRSSFESGESASESLPPASAGRTEP